MQFLFLCLHHTYELLIAILIFQLYLIISHILKRVETSDYKFGFGGEFGVDARSIDATAEDWDYFEASQKHVSQLGKMILSVSFVLHPPMRFGFIEIVLRVILTKTMVKIQ